MKRLLSFAMSTILCAMVLLAPLTASAETVQNKASNDTVVSSYVEHYADGSYAEIKITKNTSGDVRTAAAQLSSWTQSGSKQFTWYKGDGQPAIRFTVYGTFNVYGSGADCIDTSYDSNIYDNACSVQSPSSYGSGNSAIGEATLVRKILFVTVGSKYVRLVLSCDGNGNLS